MSEESITPPGWTKVTLPLSPSHQWKSAPGYNVLALDRGVLRLEYPRGWHVVPAKGNIGIHDQPPTKEDCRVMITTFRLPPLGGGRNWSDLSLESLLPKPGEADLNPGRQHNIGPTAVSRPGLEYVWQESTWIDPENGRTIICRQVIARGPGLIAIITTDYYESRRDDFQPIWTHMIESLRLGAPTDLLGNPQN
jgi:hypothetical protein